MKILKEHPPYENSTIELLRDCETARNAVLKDTEVCAIYKDGALHVADKIADYECRLAYNATDEYYDLVADESDRIYNAMVEWESLPKERGCYTDETLTMMNTLVLLFMHRRAALKLKLIHFMPNPLYRRR